LKTLVLGLGNPILGDDSVGLKIVQEVARRVKDPEVEVAESMVSGLGLLDFLVGRDRVVLVDAIQTKDGRPGTVRRLRLDDLNILKHTASPHDTNLPTVMELARQWKLALPVELAIVAVEIPPDCSTFTEKCSPAIEAAVPVAVDLVMGIIRPSPQPSPT
jgi:hydrogenase maturation protease